MHGLSLFSYLIVITCLLGGADVCASSDHREDDVTRKKARSQQEIVAFEKFKNLKQSRTHAKIASAVVRASSSSAACSPASPSTQRVHFGDTTHYEAMHDHKDEEQTLSLQKDVSDVFELSDHMEGLTLSPSQSTSLPKRKRSASVSEVKTAHVVKRSPKLEKKPSLNAPAPEITLDAMSENSSPKILPPKEDVLREIPLSNEASSSLIRTDLPTASLKKPVRKRAIQRSLSSGDAEKKKIRSPMNAPQKQAASALHAAVSTVVVADEDDMLPVSPRGFSQVQPSSLYASLTQGMFFVESENSYFRATYSLDEHLNPTIQQALDGIKEGKSTYKFKIDMTEPRKRVLSRKGQETTVYPLSIYRGSQKLFTVECYKAEEGPIEGIDKAIAQALSQKNTSYGFAHNADRILVVSDYVEPITGERRAIFASTKKNWLKILKKTPGRVMSLGSHPEPHTYHTTSGVLICKGDLNNKRYSYLIEAKEGQLEFAALVMVGPYEAGCLEAHS